MIGEHTFLHQTAYILHAFLPYAILDQQHRRPAYESRRLAGLFHLMPEPESVLLSVAGHLRGIELAPSHVGGQPDQG